MKLKALILLISVGLTLISMAGNPVIEKKGPQDDGSKYGKDSVTCVMNLSLYREFYKQWKQSGYKNASINDALKSWKWVFENCPRSTENIYVDGVKMYDFEISRTKDHKKKNNLLDTLMMIYDRRIVFFPNNYSDGTPQEGEILGRKGVDLYQVDNERYKDVYEILGKSIELEKAKTKGPIFIYYFRSLTRMAKSGEADTASVVDAYDLISDYIDNNIDHFTKAGNSKELEQWEVIKGNIEVTFEPFANCVDLVRIYQKKFNETPDDIGLLKKITKLLDKKQCVEAPLYFSATVNLYKAEPTPESAYLIGKMMLIEKKYEEAIPYLEEASKMDNESKSYNALIFLAQDYLNLERYPLARQYALKAASLNPSAGDPYIVIGDAYAGSAKNCGTDDLTTKVAYWAAVDKYNQAKRVDPELTEKMNARIATYQKYFPATELLFFHNLNEGDPYKVECWINEETTVRAAK
ncbi:MAG: hypothetical protein WC341_08160 [Bacteroidales bacterium]|jgi:tetratricopeptide (TPR) repeat protein